MVAIRKLVASIPALAGLGYVAHGKIVSEKETTVGALTKFQEVPLISKHIAHNNLAYLAGRGAHEDGRTREGGVPI